MKDFFQHDKALVESEKIGKGTRIWAFAHILPGATIGLIATSATMSLLKMT